MNAPDITIRPEATGDEPALRALNDAAFENPAEAKIVDALRDAGLFLPSGSLVASAAGKVAGHLLLSWVPVIGSDGTRHDRVAAALGPMAVDPSRQRQGIGSKLVQASIGTARAAGARVILVLGHPEFYPRFGFTQAKPQDIPCPFPGAPDEAWMALRLDDEADPPTGTPEYPEAWNQE